MGEVLDIRPTTIHERVIRGVADTPFSNVTIRTDVDPAEFKYMRERPEYFPGVEVTRRYLRQYPHDKLAAQLFGTISEITEEQRKDRGLRGDRAGHADRPERPGGRVRQVPARRSTATAASWSTPSAAATRSAGCRCASPSRASG